MNKLGVVWKITHDKYYVTHKDMQQNILKKRSLDPQKEVGSGGVSASL